MKLLSLLAAFVGAGVVVLTAAASAAALTSTSGGGWEWLQPQPQGNRLAALDFIDSRRGWAAGEYGTILHTEDGGATWTAQSTPIDEPVQAVSFVDGLHGWAASLYHVIATVDGGQHWTRQALPSEATLYDIDFGSALVGVACGTGGVTYRTANGGASWTKVQTPAQGSLKSIDMLDAQTGWACGVLSGIDAPAILRTVDGGQTWLAQNVPSASGRLSDIQAISASVAIAGGTRYNSGFHPAVFRTTDGGFNWMDITTWDDAVEASGDTGIGGAVAFLDGNHGWAFAKDDVYSDSYSVRYTADGGQSWSPPSSAPDNWWQDTDDYADRLACLDADHVLLASSSAGSHTPGIYASSDGGHTWAATHTGWGYGFAFAASFPTASDGWVAANETDPSAPNGRYDILHTSDGGASWEGQYLQTPAPGTTVNDIDFVDPQTGWAAGGRILAHTTDSGATWTQQAIGYDLSWQGQLEAIDFCDAAHGLAVGHDGLVIRTSDGSFWANVTLPAVYQDLDFYDVSTVDPSRAWMVGEGATILSSVDGGQTWTPKSAPAAKGNDLLGTFWLDATHGWAVGKNSTIIKTTNGGQTWTAQSAGPFCATLRAVSFADSQHGWCVGTDESWSGSLVLKTDDGGTTWKPQGIGYRGYAAWDVIAKDASTAFVCADGYMLKTTTGGVSPLESTAPTVTVSKPTGTWHNHAVKVTIGASDASGVKGIYSSVDRSFLITDQSLVVDSDTFGEGLHTVRAAAVDAVGNGSATASVQIGIDTRKPTKTWPLNHPSVARGGTTTLKYRIYDPAPGCGKAKVTLLIGTKTRVIKKVSIGTVATNKAISYRYRCGLARGTYMWAVTATDIAGNKVGAKNVWAWTLTVR